MDRFGIRILLALLAGVSLVRCASSPRTDQRGAARAAGQERIATESSGLTQRGGLETLTEARSTRRVPRRSGKCSEGAIPDFPMPVPAPSSRMALPPGFLNEARQQKNSRLHHAADELDRLLLSLGYSERAYFRLRDGKQTVGFAMVTRMERIHTDGQPYPDDRRFIPAGVDDRFSVLEFLKGLFIAPVGHYRVLVFTVSREPVKATGPQIDGVGAEEWLSTGSTRLLGCVAQKPLTRDYGVDVLIYEFRHAPEEHLADSRGEQRERRTTRVSQVIPSKLDPALHLRRTGIFGARRPPSQP